MCRGFGRTQQAILALIAAEPGPWTVEELVGAIYPGDGAPTRSQLNSLTRALKSMTLPGKWTFGRIWPDCRMFLYDARRRNDVGVRLAVIEEPMRAFEVEIDGEGNVVRVVGEV
jgi:hypothetical protein